MGGIFLQKLNMAVEAGAPENVNLEQKLQRQTMEERRLAEMMIPKKKKRLYDKIMYAKKKKNQEVIGYTGLSAVIGYTGLSAVIGYTGLSSVIGYTGLSQ